MNSNVEHILYNTVGQTFEQYLTAPELYNMGLVSTTSRSGILATQFRQMASFLLNLKQQLVDIPLRTHSKISGYAIDRLYEVAEFLWNANELSTEVIICLRIELGHNELVKKAIIDTRNISFFLNNNAGAKDIIQKLGYDMGLYDLALKYPNVDVFFAYESSIRFNASIFEYIIQTNFPRPSIWKDEMYYYLDPQIRALVVKYNNSIVDEAFTQSYLSVNVGPKDIDGFALCMPEYLFYITYLAIKFKDEDLYNEYTSKYFNAKVTNLQYNTVQELYTKLGGYKP